MKQQVTSKTAAFKSVVLDANKLKEEFEAAPRQPQTFEVTPTAENHVSVEKELGFDENDYIK